MTQWKLLGSTAVLAAMAGNAAWAITPEEVWAKWKNLSATNGQTLTTGGEAREGDALVITDMTLTHTKDGSAMTMTVPEVRLEDVGGGKVEITLTDTGATVWSFSAFVTDFDITGVSPEGALQANVTLRPSGQPTLA